MYLKINEIVRYFEASEFIYFFNNINYTIYSYKDKKDLIYREIYIEEDFLCIDSISIHKIIKQYLIFKNNKNLLKKQQVIKEDEFLRSFHWYIEGDNKYRDYLLSEWEEFHKSALVEIATNWCRKNNINYTLK